MRLAARLGIEVLDVLVGAVHKRLEVGKDARRVVVEDRLDLAVDMPLRLSRSSVWRP